MAVVIYLGAGTGADARVGVSVGGIVAEASVVGDAKGGGSGSSSGISVGAGGSGGSSRGGGVGGAGVLSASCRATGSGRRE